jgi:hypothetical protein
VATLLIPCSAGADSRWVQRTSLAGRDYVFTFEWNTRAGRWSVSIADQDGAVIAEGLTLAAGARLLRGVVGDRRPPGELVVLDTTGLYDLDPGFGDLGSRFQLAYLDPADAAAAFA